MRPLARTHKYRAKPQFEDGHYFASKAEWMRYRGLKIQQANGLISDLELQPRFPLVVNGIKCGTYVADFRYWDIEKAERVVEDVKGVVTAVYKLKKKLMKALYGIEIKEVPV